MNTMPTLVTRPRGVLRHECMAWLPDELIAPKAAGFIADTDASLVRASQDHMRVRVGSRFPFVRGHRGAKLPIEMSLTVRRETTCVQDLAHLIIDMRPLVFGAGDADVKARCTYLARSIRAWFMAVDLERRFAFRAEATFPITIWAVAVGTAQPNLSATWYASGQNVSASGMAFESRQPVPVGDVLAKFRHPGTLGIVAARAAIVRHVESNEGPCFYAARFFSASTTSAVA